MNVSRYVRRVGAMLPLLVGSLAAQTPPMQVGQSVWVKFFASGDTSETKVARGVATWKKCGPKMVWGRFYTGPDSTHLTLLRDDSLAIPVPCAVLPAPVASLSMSLDALTLAPGQTTVARAIAKDSTGALLTRLIAWSSTNTSIATVSDSGVVSAISVGSSTIRATAETKSAVATLIVVLPQPPPDTTPARIVVSPSTLTLQAANPQTLTAAITTAAGAALPLSPTSWSSSDPTKATVSASGVVTWVAQGTATVIARYNALSSNAVIVTALPPSPPSPGHPNEPAGFAPLSPMLTGDIQPPNTSEYVPGSANEIGWIRANSVNKVTDLASPEGSTNVLEIPFPSGMIGGGSPGSAYTSSSTNPQNWPSSPRSLYQSYWYKVSLNFPANLVGNKIVYSNIGGGNKVYSVFGGGADYHLDGSGKVVFAPGASTQYNTALFVGVDIQDVIRVDDSFAPSFNLGQNAISANPLLWHQLVRGQWHHIETLYTANTAGQRDGGVKLWMDGVLLVDFTNRIQWSQTADNWDWTNWLPVYGGGGSIPNDGVGGYHRLKDFYVSGPAPTARRTPTKQP